LWIAGPNRSGQESPAARKRRAEAKRWKLQLAGKPSSSAMECGVRETRPASDRRTRAATGPGPPGPGSPRRRDLAGKLQARTGGEQADIGQAGRDHVGRWMAISGSRWWNATLIAIVLGRGARERGGLDPSKRAGAARAPRSQKAGAGRFRPRSHWPSRTIAACAGDPRRPPTRRAEAGETDQASREGRGGKSGQETC